MATSRQELGKWGEVQAAKFLVENEYVILARNYRTRYGEIDLVAENNWGIIFIEVKTRSSTTFGMPETAITSKKRDSILKSALAYLQKHPEYDCDWRIDVIAIQCCNSKQTHITHFENAITG
jgi:putative endonuclease